MIFTKNGYSLKYNLLHPWELIAHFFRDIHCAWQRANKGYCYRDLWAIDSWFLKIIPSMIDDFNKIKTGYPSEMTEEEWTKVLKTMSESFKKADPDNKLLVNHYEEKYDELILKPWIDFMNKKNKEVVFCEKNGNIFGVYYSMSDFIKSLSEEQQQIDEAYHALEKDIMINQEKNLQIGFDLFIKYFKNLWD